MRVVSSRSVRSWLAPPILCAIVFALITCLHTRVDAAPLVVIRDDAPNQPSSGSSVVTEKDRDTDTHPGGGSPNSGGRDVPIHVPEPATLILTGIGLAGLAARRARRTRAIRS